MNLYKIALSLLVTAAPAAARLSSDEKDSSAMMRELMTKVDALNSKVTSLEADNKSLKSKVASLEKRRGLMPDIEGMDLPNLDGLELPTDMDFKDLADKLEVDVDPSSVGGPLYGILDGIISSLLGVTNCVGFGIDVDRRRLSSERRLGGYGGEASCFFGGFDIDNVFIGAQDEIGIGLPDSNTDSVIIEADLEIVQDAWFIDSFSFQQFADNTQFGVLSGEANINGVEFNFNPNFDEDCEIFDECLSSQNAVNKTEVREEIKKKRESRQHSGN